MRSKIRELLGSPMVPQRFGGKFQCLRYGKKNPGARSEWWPAAPVPPNLPLSGNTPTGDMGVNGTELRYDLKGRNELNGKTSEE